MIKWRNLTSIFMEAKVVVACDYLPDTDGLSQHRMFRVNMTLKAATDEPIETLI